MKEGRDFWWHELMDEASADCPAEPLDSEAPLFILYTSGSTGKPKGIKHTTAGYNLYAKKTIEWVFDIRDDDVYWCTADIGWITGHSYIVYGPLSAGATVADVRRRPQLARRRPLLGDRREVQGQHLLHRPDGHPGVHQVGRRARRQARPLQPAAAGHRRRRHQPRSLDVVPQEDRRRALPDRRHLVADRDRRDHDDARCPAPFPPSRAAARKPLPGIVPEIVGEDGQAGRPADSGGWLIIAKPWPGMLRGIWGDDERYQGASTGATCPASTSAGDNARCDEDGYYWIMGRIDDVLNVSGHRLSTIEIESALVSHPAVAEAAAVGRPHDLKGEAVAVFVTLPRRRAERGAAQGAEAARPQGDRRAGRARRHPLHRRAAQDPQRQDHAATAQATSPPGKRPSATPRRWKTTACWPGCGTNRRIAEWVKASWQGAVGSGTVLGGTVRASSLSGAGGDPPGCPAVVS